MSKVYSSKSNAVRAFRTNYAEAAANLTNDQIRADYLDEDDGGYVLIDPATVQAEDDFEMSAAELAAQKARGIDYDTATYEEVRASKCPHCGIELDNGLLSIDDEAPNSDKTVWEAGLQTHQWSCMGCNGEFGKDYGPYAKPAAAPRQPTKRTGTGVKIEANREQRNGVKRPSAGGVCREVWDECDAMLARNEQPTVKALKELAPSRGWNANNAAIEFYQWRKFNGITGRAK